MEGALVRTEILLAHEAVGLDDGDEAEPFEVEPFRDDLRTYENVDLSLPEVPDDAGLLRGRSVAVQPRDAAVGQKGTQFFFDPLRAGSERLEFSVAGRAVAGIGLRVAAVVADQAVGMQVQAERYMAVRTPGNPSAFRTLD